MGRHWGYDARSAQLTVEQQSLLTHLALPLDTRIILTEMTTRLWGRDITFTCLADERSFRLQFGDCRETRWQFYSHIQHEDAPAFPLTELANLKIGRDQHRSPAHLLTEHFGLSLVYGSLTLHHNDTVIAFGQ